MMTNRILLLLFSVLLMINSSCDQAQKKVSNKKNVQTKRVVSIPYFSADSAFAYVAKQVSFGPRVNGSEAHANCLQWLSAKAGEFADTVILQRFKARTYDKVTRNGTNIIASFQPDKKERILLMAHWDSRPFADHDADEANFDKPIDGANDGASGVGVLLEIARHLKTQTPDMGIDIVFFDLEDWGPPTQMDLFDENYWGLGSQHWSKTPHKPGYKANFGILLDMVGAKNPSFQKEYFSKEYARYFLDLVWNTASDLGYGTYFHDEDGIATTDDHYFVNKYAKIPSIDIIHLENRGREGSFYEHWHTTEDSLDKIDPETLRMVGEVVMTVIYNQ